MTREEIWKYIVNNHDSTRLGGTKFYSLSKEKWKVVAPYIKPVSHYFNSYEQNFRSDHLWSHFHATLRDGVYEIHQDFANPNKLFPLMLLPHLIFEVAPYFIKKIYRL